MPTKQIFLVFILCCSFLGNAQNSLRNFGNIGIRNNANVHLSTNLVNDGALNANSGTIGFYGENILEVLGAFPVEAFNMEIATEAVILSNNIKIENDLHFVHGDIINNKNDTSSIISFLENSDYFGASTFSKINGLALLSGKSSFLFPVGAIDRLQPLKIESETVQENMLCAYFFNSPPNNTNTSETIVSISETEYWFLSSEIPTKITISWDEESKLSEFTNDIEQLSLVGLQHKK